MAHLKWLLNVMKAYLKGYLLELKIEAFFIKLPFVTKLFTSQRIFIEIKFITKLRNRFFKVAVEWLLQIYKF